MSLSSNPGMHSTVTATAALAALRMSIQFNNQNTIQNIDVLNCYVKMGYVLWDM